MSGRETGSGTTTFLAAIAAFAAGIGAGWLLFAGESEPRESAAPAAAAPHAESAQPASSRRTRTGEGAATTDADRVVAAALAAPSDLPALTGTGTIRGTVKTDAGEPLGGVEVRAFAYTPPEWNAETRGRTWDEIPLEDALRRSVRERRWREASRKTATTGADGAFELTGLADVNWSVTAHAAGYEFHTAPDTPHPARAGKPCGFVATPSVRVALDVRLPDGSRPRGASLQWAGAAESQQLHQQWAPGGESFSMRPGRWRVTATGGEDDRYAAPPLDVDVRADMAPVVVTLKERPGIVVSATRPDGFAGLKVRFFAVRAEGAAPTDDELRASRTTGGPMDPGFWDDDAGHRRSFFDLAPGPWLVAAGLDGAPLARRTVEVADRVVDVELAVPAPDMSQFVEVRVEGPDGSPVAAATVGWQYRAAHEAASYGTTTIARGAGVWLLRRVGPGDRSGSYSRSGAHDPNGRWFVSVSVPGFGPAEAEATAGSAGVVVRLRTPAIAIVRVTGLPPGVDAKHVTAWVGSDLGSVGQALGADGSAKVAPVSPGSCEVRISVQLSEWSNVVVARRTVELAAGENAVEIAVPTLYPLDLDFGASQAGETQFIEKLADDDSTESIVVEFDPAGRAKIALLPAGRYRVNVDGKEHEFRVPETRTFKLP